MKATMGIALLIPAAAFSQVGSTYTDHYLSTLVIPIQDWNMLADETHSMALNEYSTPPMPPDWDPMNVVSVEAAVHDDAGQNAYNFVGGKLGNTMWGGWFHLYCYQGNAGCQVQMNRGPSVSSRFAKSTYSAMGNRGYVIVKYHSPGGATWNGGVHSFWKDLGSSNMSVCGDGSACIAPSIPSNVTPGTVGGINGFIRSDNEPTTIISNFENLNSDNLTKGKGGLLQLTTSRLLFGTPYNERSQPNYSARFKTTRYDGTGSRGYYRVAHVGAVSPAGRQPFVVKSKYIKIGSWCFTSLDCMSNTQRKISTSYLTSSPQRIISSEAAIYSDPMGGTGGPILISGIRRGDERSPQAGTGPTGSKLHGEIAADLGSTSGSVALEVSGNHVDHKYWRLNGHATSPSRGWVKADYLAAKCGEGGNGFFTSAANIGFPNPPGAPAQDCNGAATIDNIRTHVIESQGNDIYGAADQFRYVYSSTSSTGNFALAAKIDQVENTNTWSLGCIMMRSTTAPNSPNVAVCRIGQGQPTFQYRLPSNLGSTAQNAFQGLETYKWAKLVKIGNTITGYVAKGNDTADPQAIPASSWTSLGSVSGVISGGYTYGLAASSFSATNPATVGILGVKTWVP